MSEAFRELEKRLDQELRHRFGISLQSLSEKDVQLLDSGESELFRSLAEFTDKENGFSLHLAQGHLSNLKKYDYILDNARYIEVMYGKYRDDLNVNALQNIAQTLKPGGEFIQSFSLDIELVRILVNKEPGDDITEDDWNIAAKVVIDIADLELKGVKCEMISKPQELVSDIHNVIFKLKTNAS